MKFVKYSWEKKPDGTEAYAIVKPLTIDSPEVQKSIMDSGLAEKHIPEDTLFGILIYGSKRGYSDSGTVFMYSNVVSVEELDDDSVFNEHFVGLL